MAAGLGVVQIADSSAYNGGNPFSATNLFFVGLLFVFLPAAVRILMRKTANAERFALVMLLCLAFYAVKILASPDGFLLNDEYIHFRNTQDILSTGHLFQYNPLLPTAAYYPGLASITAAMTDFTGLSIYVNGLIVIGVARILIVACIYFVAEKITRSSRGAGLAALLYITNSMFLFYTAQFAYEDLALPLAAFAVWWITRTRGLQEHVAAQVITVVVIVAVTVTHHVSAFALCAILAALYIAERFFKYPEEERRYVGIFALLTGALALFWFFVVAKPAAGYLFGQNFIPALQSAVSALTGHSGRQLYGSSTGSAPKWYIYAGFADILIIMGAVLQAALRAWRMVRADTAAALTQGRAAIAVATIVSLTFPFTLLPRLTAVGSAISGRTSEFIFAAIGCTLGLLMVDVRRMVRTTTAGAGRLARLGSVGTLTTALLLVPVFLGQISIGESYFGLLPDPVAAFPAYVEPDMITAAYWSREHLGTGQTFATDSTNILSIATYGDENPVNVNIIYPLFFTDSMDGVAASLIKDNNVHYVLLDWVATEEAPNGAYYAQLEPDSSLHGKPLPQADYAKFSAYTCSRLVYQSGPIQIYDVSKIANGTCVPSVRS